jgi:alkylation response protein AidB-like acyl-CoA dehydrogenase
MDIAVEYAKTRKQFGHPIGQYQAVQHQCADMLVWTESSRSAAYYAAYAMNEGIAEARAAVSVAKVYASDACREVGNRGVQVQGGMGFTWENDTHLFYRRAKKPPLLLRYDETIEIVLGNTFARVATCRKHGCFGPLERLLDGKTSAKHTRKFSK